MVVFLGKEQVTQGTAFNSLGHFCQITGKRVLEVGGNSDCVAATPFALNGASEVVVTGLYHMDANSIPSHPAITLEAADALKLSDKYSAGSFDLVYGISVLEHIPSPGQFLSQVAHVLSRGGMAFLQGAPIWNGPWGHHIHLTPWQDNTIGCYQFIPSQVLLDQGVKVFNPIPDWGHLLYSPDQLAAILRKFDLPGQDLERILSAVYRDDVISRESVNALLRAVAQSGLMVVELEFDRVQIPDGVREQLNDLHGVDEDFSIMGIRIVLRKN